jgi:hypothetical protein
MTEQQVTLNDVRQLAAQFGIAFTDGGEDDTWFDLDTSPDTQWGLNGTYQKSAAGVTTAYSDLIRYRDRINQVHSSPNRRASL